MSDAPQYDVLIGLFASFHLAWRDVLVGTTKRPCTMMDSSGSCCVRDQQGKQRLRCELDQRCLSPLQLKANRKNTTQLDLSSEREPHRDKVPTPPP